MMPTLLMFAAMRRSCRRAGAAAGVAVLCASTLGGLLPAPAAAQVAPGPTTTPTSGVAASDGATTSAPPGPDTTTGVPATTTTVPATTTTTVPTPAWVASVPGPPSPPPVTASPADLALAARLEQQIVADAKALDVLAEQFDQAQQTAQASAANLVRIQADLTAAGDRAAAAETAVAGSRRLVHDTAIAAYVGVVTHTQPAGTNSLVEAYERGLARVIGETALGKAGEALTQLHLTEAVVKRERDAVAAEQQQAATESSGAAAAAAAAQSKARAAATAQVQLLTSVSHVQGNVATLVAAAQAAEALAAYLRFSSGGGQLDFPTPVPLAAPPGPVLAALQAALAQVGKPYVWGAVGPDSYDCSGLMKWSWAQVGVAIPRTAAEQQAWAVPVPISQLQPGDLVFFGSPAHHVGMYAGNGTMVDAPHSGAFVGVVPIWWSDLAGFGRVRQP